MRVLLVEDDARLAKFVATGLRENGSAVDMAADGTEGAYLGASDSYDVIVLDILLPGQSGYAVLRELRGKGIRTPILCLTARDRVEDRVTGLDLGADDYLVKPFHFPELLARLRALHRRSPKLAPTQLQCGDLRLDTATRHVTRAGHKVELTVKEFALLEYLMRHGGSVVTRTALIENIWDMNFESMTNVVDVFINRLRLKIDKPFDQRLLHTIRGVGYVLKAEEPQ